MRLTPERWSRVGKILDEALDAEPRERATMIDRLIGGDVELREEVLAFLDADERAGEVLERPVTLALEGDPSEPVRDRVGERIGPYRLIHRIGSGGMGTVYEAERADERFEKRVAVKLVRGGPDRRETVERFRRERRILAALEHPNVARILDAGVTEDGVPFFVMEHVEGAPIDRYCAERDLSIRDRLELFLEVCEAVRYAHQRLVVHRDLKPSNVLVTAEGRVKLLDFGVAKLLAEAGEDDATVTGAARPLTPAYASPEQLEGKPVSTAADVYSLGAVLYEVLTGRRPLDVDASPVSISRAIGIDPDPPSEAVADEAWGERASEVRKRLDGDLDQIVLTALRKEPDRRYESVERLADDVRRHLDGRPVRARPDSFGYRTSKFVRRHRIGLAAAAIAALAVIGGAVATGWQARVARTQAAVAAVERDRAATINDFLLQMLGAADPNVQGRDVRVADLLDTAAERASTELDDRPAVAADVLRTLARTYRGLGLLEPAAERAREAVEMRRDLASPPPRDLAADLVELGIALRESGAYEDAEAGLREAVDRLQTAGPEADLERAAALDQLAITLKQVGEDEEAEALYRQALAIYDRALAEPDERTARVRNDLGVLLGDRGELAEAERLHREALEIMREVHGPEHPEVAYTLYNVAGVVDLEKRYGESAELYEETLEMRNRLLGVDHPLTIMTATSLGYSLFNAGQEAAGERRALVALDRAREALPPDHPLTSYAEVVVGEIQLGRGRPVDAEPHLREALRIRRAFLPPDHWLLANVESLVGESLADQGRYAEAEPLLVHAYETLLADRGFDHEKTEMARERLVELYRATGRPALAERIASPRGASASRTAP